MGKFFGLFMKNSVTRMPVNWCTDVITLCEVSKKLLYVTIFTISLQTGSPTSINVYENCPEENKTMGMCSVFFHMHMHEVTKAVWL